MLYAIQSSVVSAGLHSPAIKHIHTLLKLGVIRFSDFCFCDIKEVR